MTVVIFALDGLDAEYCQEAGLLRDLRPETLENDPLGYK